MTIEDQLQGLLVRHTALTESVELLLQSHLAVSQQIKETNEGIKGLERASSTILRIAAAQQRRIESRPA